MIGGSGLLIYNIAKHLKHGEPKGKLYFAAVAATGIGTIIGGIYGLHEAKQLNTYRAALAKDIETLHAQMDGLDKTPGR